jgi:hypothetical protein
MPWPLYCHRKSCGFYRVVGWVCAETGKDILEKTYMFCYCQDLNPGSSSIYTSQFIEFAIAKIEPQIFQGTSQSGYTLQWTGWSLLRIGTDGGHLWVR